jgi:hypothetical protein
MSFEQRHRAEDVLSEWNEIEMEFTNENGIAGKGDCFEKSKGEVILILRVEKSGVISGAYTSKDNAKATCLVENHKGIVLPQPPFGPVYVLKRMM